VSPSGFVSLDRETSNLVRVEFYLIAAAHLHLKFEQFSKDFTWHDLCCVFILPQIVKFKGLTLTKKMKVEAGYDTMFTKVKIDSQTKCIILGFSVTHFSQNS
jgi:hypothetical protein